MILNYKNSTIYYKVEGQGSAVILLHGFLETTAMWDDIVPILSESHKVIVIDLLGHGKSDCIGYVHTMEAMADAVVAVLEHLEIDKGTFIGHSMGGYVALALAEKKPELFEGLCLMNSTFEADDKERKQLRTRSSKLAQGNFTNLVRMSFTNLFAPESRERYTKEFEEALAIALTTPVQGYIAAQEGMKLRPNRFNTFKNLDCKKGMIIGAKDSIVDGKKLLAHIEGTNIDFVEFSGGHMSHIENKSELSYFLKRFIEK